MRTSLYRILNLFLWGLNFDDPKYVKMIDNRAFGN